MYHCLSKPNIPERKVAVAAVNSRAGECIKGLNKNGIRVLQVPPMSGFYSSLASHADLHILPLLPNRYYLSEHMFGLSFANIKDLEITIPGLQLQKYTGYMNECYPDDVPLNAAVIGRHFICNIKTVAPALLQEAMAQGLKVIPVKQGYTKCSVCILNEHAIITDDESIYRGARLCLDDVTLVEKNSIRLEGFDTGFIGGATGLIGKDVLAVNGSIMSHSSHNAIIDALARNGITAVELHQGPMEDVGSIIPIAEVDD